MHKQGHLYTDVFTESVYNLQQQLQHHGTSQRDRYVSIHAPAVIGAFRESVQAPRRKSFGIPRLPTRSPTKYLKKHEKLPPVRLPAPREAKRHRSQHEKVITGVSAKVQCKPKQISNCSMHIHERLPINWREKNKRMVSKPTEEPADRYPAHAAYRIDRPNGERRRMDRSELAPHYRLKKSYGSVPSYIHRYREVHKDQQRNTIAKQKAYEQQLSSKARSVTDDERCEVIQGLEARLKRSMQLFQGLSVVLDNQTKLRDRQHLEREINDLEKLIGDLKSHKIVIVSPTDHHKK